MDTTDLGYLFGCCAACRAPFVPSRALSPEEQSVLYMQARFEEIALKLKTPSGFTGRKENAHLVARAKYSAALVFVYRLAPGGIDAGLQGWNSNIKIVKFDQGFAEHTAAKPGSRGAEPEGGEADPELVQQIRDAQAAAAAVDADSESVANAIAESIAKNKMVGYRASWGRPETDVEHKELAAWLLNNKLKEIDVDLTRTTACCELCNDIWDCWARMRSTMEDSGVVRANSVHVQVSKSGKKSFHTLPSSGAKSVVASALGGLVAYYLHASLRKLKGHLGDAVFEVRRRQPLVMLLWLPLHVNCMYAESKAPEASPGRPSKGFHNYVGCLDLLISYYVYVSACADEKVEGSRVPFEKFHVLYMKELAEAPEPVWPRATGLSRVHEFVFDPAYDGIGANYAKQISHVSDRLHALYRERVRPLFFFAQGKPVRALPGSPGSSPAGSAGSSPPGSPGSPVSSRSSPAYEEAAAAHFLTYAEADALTRDALQVGSRDLCNVRTHLAHVGIHALTWQLRRALLREPKEFGRELDRWINARMQVEWRNMAASGSADGVSHAQLIYYAQHTRAPPRGSLLPSPDDDGDEADAVRGLQGLGLCSIWKAAHRLAAFGFTTQPRSEPALYYEEDEDGAGGLSAALGALRISRPGARLLLGVTATPPASRGPRARTSAAARPRASWAGAAAAPGPVRGARSTA